MSLIGAVYLAFAVALLGGLCWTRPSRDPTSVAATLVYIGALCWLPAADYYGVVPEVVAPPWYIGFLVPVPHLWLNKAWIAPLAALALLGRLRGDRLGHIRPKLCDLPLVLFCLWPLVQGLLVADPSPPPWLTSLLLIGCWGLPWLLGRLSLNQRTGRVGFADAMILFTLLLAPIAIVEGVTPFRVHDLLFGPHPFARDGVDRYYGFRPLAFFENGNQYGIWVASAGLCGWWRARIAPVHDYRTLRWAIALGLIIMVFASQSVGAIVMMLGALAALEAAGFLARHRWLIAALGATFAGLATAAVLTAWSVHRGGTGGLLGTISLHLLEHVRGSLKWRLARSMDAFDGLLAHPMIGWGRWDWYESSGFRPWDLWVLLTGQFGLIGIGLIACAVMAAFLEKKTPNSPKRGPSSRHFAMSLIALAFADSLLNSFVFLPALALLGGLAGHSAEPRGRPPQRQALRTR